MKLTIVEEALIYGLDQFNLSEETRESVFLFLKTEDQQLLMIKYLAMHAGEDLKDQEALNTMGAIIRMTSPPKK